MDSFEAGEDYQNIYLPPDVYMNEELLDLAYEYFSNLETSVMAQRIDENSLQDGITPFIEASKSLSHWRYIETCLNNFRAILLECMGSSEVISSNLLTLSQTIAAYKSIEEQMYLIYLNLFKIHSEVFSDDALYSQVIQEAEKQAEVAKDELNEWLREVQRQHPPEFQQLSLSL